MRIYVSLLLICSLVGCANSAAQRLEHDNWRTQINIAQNRYVDCALKKAGGYASSTQESPSDISSVSIKFCEHELIETSALIRKDLLKNLSRDQATLAATKYADDLENKTREACRALVLEVRATKAASKK